MATMTIARFSRSVALIFVFVTFAFVASGGPAFASDPASLLERYATYLSRLGSFDLHFTTNVQAFEADDGGRFVKSGSGRSLKGTFRYAVGDRFFKRFDSEDSFYEVCFDGSSYISAGIAPHPMDGGRLEVVASSVRSASMKNPRVARGLDESAWIGSMLGLVARGWINSDGPALKLPSVLRESGRIEVFDADSDLPKLNWTDGRISVEIVLSAEHDFAPRRIEYLAVEPLAEEGTRALVKQSYEVDKFQRVEEVWYPKEVLTLLELSSGINVVGTKQRASQHTSHVTIDEVSVNRSVSADDFQLTFEIPNGTKVHMEDAEHLNFKWLDGKIVPMTDEEALKHAREATLTFLANQEAEPASFQPGLVVGTVVFVLFLGLGLVIGLKYCRNS
jgi:hypothetical protein